MGDLWKAGLASRLPQASTILGENSAGHCTCALKTSHGDPGRYAL